MNIHTASDYMKHGYRIRRATWNEFEYIYKDYYIGHMVMVPNYKKNPDGSLARDSNGKFIKGTHPFYTDWQPQLEDLMADDWELILDGIVSDFNEVKYKD